MNKEKFCKLSVSLGYVPFKADPNDFCKTKEDDYEYTDKDFIDIYRFFDSNTRYWDRKYHHFQGTKTTKHLKHTNI